MSSYSIAECFTSPQGEAQWTGTLMRFVRFAGCNVGKPYTEEERNTLNCDPHTSLSIYQEKCRTQMGFSFSCDTNYALAKKMTAEEIAKGCEDVEHVCLTGGEPLLHDLFPLIALLHSNYKKVHIETSGTKSLKEFRQFDSKVAMLWITVSPKIGCLSDSLDIADEIKVLVGDEFDEIGFRTLYQGYFHKLWLQPVNYEHQLNMQNIKKCLELQIKYPQCRVSVQMHKILGVR